MLQLFWLWVFSLKDVRKQAIASIDFSTLSKLHDVPVGFVAPSPSFETVYCFIFGRWRVAVARYWMICLDHWRNTVTQCGIEQATFTPAFWSSSLFGYFMKTYVSLAIFQPYRDLEAGDNTSLISLRLDQKSNLQAKSFTTTPQLLLPFDQSSFVLPTDLFRLTLVSSGAPRTILDKSKLQSVLKFYKSHGRKTRWKILYFCDNFTGKSHI